MGLRGFRAQDAAECGAEVAAADDAVAVLVVGIEEEVGSPRCVLCVVRVRACVRVCERACKRSWALCMLLCGVFHYVEVAGYSVRRTDVSCCSRCMQAFVGLLYFIMWCLLLFCMLVVSFIMSRLQDAQPYWGLVLSSFRPFREGMRTVRAHNISHIAAGVEITQLG